MRDIDKNILITVLAFGFILCLAILSFAEIPIYCPHEKILLYYYQEEIIGEWRFKAEDFKPADISIPQPLKSSLMICPLCSSPLNGYEWWNWEKGISPPKFIFRAVTLLTKDENGNFKFVPYDFQPEDWEDKY